MDGRGRCACVRRGRTGNRYQSRLPASDASVYMKGRMIAVQHHYLNVPFPFGPAFAGIATILLDAFRPLPSPSPCACLRLRVAG